MNYPKIQFSTDLDRLADYLCYVAKQVACGYYQDRRFLVLPRLEAKDARTIFLPDLNFPSQFWEQLTKFKPHEYLFHFDRKTVEIAGQLLRNLSQPTSHSSLEKRWSEKEKEFFTACEKFIPAFNWKSLRYITVLVSPFGSVGSLFFQKKGKRVDLELTVRADFGPAQVAETIITSLFHMDRTNTSVAEWTNREAIIDFLLSKTKLGKIFDFDYQPTVSSLPEISSNLILESEKYLEKLGFPVKPVALKCRFTQTEQRIWDALTTNKGQLLTYDQIGNLFWGEEESLEKFSLYSIAKIMEKIRKKIKDQGIYQELIYTVRGQGYVVYD